MGDGRNPSPPPLRRAQSQIRLSASQDSDVDDRISKQLNRSREYDEAVPSDGADSPCSQLPNIEVVSPGLAEDRVGTIGTPNAIFDAAFTLKDNRFSRRERERIARIGTSRPRLATTVLPFRGAFGLNHTFDSTSSVPVSRERKVKPSRARGSRHGQELGKNALSMLRMCSLFFAFRVYSQRRLFFRLPGRVCYCAYCV